MEEGASHWWVSMEEGASHWWVSMEEGASHWCTGLAKVKRCCGKFVVKKLLF
jgi:hypothetical protein